MKSTISVKTAFCILLTLSLPWLGRGEEQTLCDRVFKEVRAAVEKEPQKVLVIVEDNMVANETCACEIVKAAIIGSKASSELKQQIVLAATHVAPNMSPIIAQCAGMAPGGVKVAKSGKEVESVNPGGKEVVEAVNPGGKEVANLEPVVQPTPPMDDSTGGADYKMTPSDIRGVYVIQPSTSGITFKSTKTIVVKKTITKRRPSKHSVAQSSSVAKGP